MIQPHYNIRPAIECDLLTTIAHMGFFSKLILIKETYYHPHNHPSLAINFQIKVPNKMVDMKYQQFCTWSSQKKIKSHFLSPT